MKKIQLALIALFAVAIVGCGGTKVEIAEVSGTVTMNGQPLEEVKVTFAPDPEQMTEVGKASHAITDENGKYRLKYSGDQAEFGAQVGVHRITALDIMAENSRDNPISVRIHRKYKVASKTDLTYEVKSGGPHTHDFELESAQ